MRFSFKWWDRELGAGISNWFLKFFFQLIRVSVLSFFYSNFKEAPIYCLSCCCEMCITWWCQLQLFTELMEILCLFWDCFPLCGILASCRLLKGKLCWEIIWILGWEVLYLPGYFEFYFCNCLLESLTFLFFSREAMKLAKFFSGQLISKYFKLAFYIW